MSAVLPHTSASTRSQSQPDLHSVLFQASRPNVPAAQFCQVFLKGTTRSLRASAAVIWRVHADSFQMLAQYHLEKIGFTHQTGNWLLHQQLIMGIAQSDKPARLKPGEATRAGANPLNQELLCVPFTAENGVQFVVEVVDADTGEDGLRYPQQLAQLNLLCDYFRDYVQSQALRLKADQKDSESLMRGFATRVNAAGTCRELASVAVNDGRRVIGCDRLSLGWRTGRGIQILSVSGLDSVDSRSNAIRALVNFTKAAISTSCVAQLEFPPAAPRPADNPPPEREKSSEPDTLPQPYRQAMQRYPESNRPRYLTVIPLGDAAPNGTRNGALILEQFGEETIPSDAVERAMYVAENVRLTMRRLQILESIPILALWSRVSQGNWSRRLLRVLLLIGVLAGAFQLAMMPLDLKLPATGDLAAQSRHAIFAPESGTVREVLVDHGSRIQAGETILVLENLELSAQHRELNGQLARLGDRRRSLEARRSGARLSEREQIELQSEIVEAATSMDHTLRQIKLLQERLDHLNIRAPADGVVTTWNVRQTLLHRTVLPGDALVEEIEPDGGWAIELRIPEDRVGYIAQSIAHSTDNKPLDVEYVLATQPEERYSATVRNIGSRTEVTADGHIVRATLDLDRNHLPPLRDGAEVKARLNCGPRPAGFVFFREFIEVIQTYCWY